MPAHHTKNTSRRGISLIESVAAMVILAGAMAASINTVASARASQVMAAQRAKARVLAQSMLQEALNQPYAEHDTDHIGPDAGEPNNNTRSQFDDVDDYHGWTNTVREPDGTPIAGFEDYQLSFTVHWCKPDDPDRFDDHDHGAKRVIVTLSRNGRTHAQVSGWSVAP